MTRVGFCVEFVSPDVGKSSPLAHDLAVGLPSLFFLVFLGWNLKPSLRKLQRSQSNIMLTYYVFLWTISLLNFARCCVQIGQTHAGHPLLWNLLWLVTRFGMMVGEVSVVVFLLHGYLTSGREALMRTLWTSGGISAADTFIKTVYIFGFGVPLFLHGGPPGAGVREDMHWSKWSFWLVHSMLFVLIYGAIMTLPLTRYRDVLPAKPSFYHYVQLLLAANGIAAVGSLLIAGKCTAGYCVYAVSNWLYLALYPPLLYMTFLAEFFADDGLDLDMMYYSEMREAGCFDVNDDLY